MIGQVTGCGGEYPQLWLVDGGYNSHEQIEASPQRTEVYAPVPYPMMRTPTHINPHVMWVGVGN